MISTNSDNQVAEREARCLSEGQQQQGWFQIMGCGDDDTECLEQFGDDRLRILTEFGRAFLF